MTISSGNLITCSFQTSTIRAHDNDDSNHHAVTESHPAQTNEHHYPILARRSTTLLGLLLDVHIPYDHEDSNVTASPTQTDNGDSNHHWATEPHPVQANAHHHPMHSIDPRGLLNLPEMPFNFPPLSTMLMNCRNSQQQEEEQRDRALCILDEALRIMNEPPLPQEAEQHQARSTISNPAVEGYHHGRLSFPKQ